MRPCGGAAARCATPRPSTRGVQVLRHYGHDINCIISDWDMTPLGGLDLLRMVRGRLIPTVSPRVG